EEHRGKARHGPIIARRRRLPPRAEPGCMIRGLRRLARMPLALLAPGIADAQPCSEPFATVFERVSPAVVSIQATKLNPSKPPRRFEAVVGSGVVIERDGQVLTNA